MSEAGPSIFARFLPPKRSARKNGRGPLEGLKTLALVVPLTILIWVYAERAQTRTEEVKVRLAFSTSDTSTAAVITDASDLTTLTLEGPRGQIEQFKRNVDEAARDGRLTLPIPADDSSVGRKTILPAVSLRTDPRFSGLNLSITTSPSEMHASVDRIVSREVAVAPPLNLQVTLRNVVFDPPRITVTGPTTLLDRDFVGALPPIPVDQSGLDLTPSGAPVTKEVSLTRHEGITLSRATVKMTYEVGSAIREGEIRTVYIDVRRPASEDGKSRVIIRDGPVVHNVQIRGPANVVEPLIGDHPDQSVKAVLLIYKDDVDKGDIRRAVDLDLKDGVTVLGGPYEKTFEVRSIAGDADR